ncbi:hypothetical protein ACFLZC_03100 [Patescibacteria group bacterium]
MQISKTGLACEVIGWVGTIALLGSQALLGLDIIKAEIPYFLIGFIACIFIVVISIYKKMWQGVAINITWSAISIIAVIRLLMEV